MKPDLEIWFDTAPAPAAIGLALARFGVLHEMRDGTLRLVEGDEAAGDGLPFRLIEAATAPAAVRAIVPTVRAALSASSVLAAGRGFWMARMAAEVQRRLGGVVYLPSSDEAFGDPEAYERSWPDDHPAHDEAG